MTPKVTRLTTMLSTVDLQSTIDFYTTLLGFTLSGTWPEQSPTWCHLTSGDAGIMFSTLEARPGAELPGSIYLYPDDVAAMWERVKDVADVDAPLRDTEYGMREFVVHDPNGYHLIFGAPIG
jgi:uncharacterized glyoxalase superfamily protein PhnB